MRGWTSFVAGFLLLALAYWLYSLGGFGSEAIICGVAAAGFILQGAFGLGVGAGDGATGLVEFIQNPADAIVDSATDRLGEWLGDRKADEEPDKKAGVNHRQALVDWLHDKEPQAAAAAATSVAAPAAAPAPPIVVQPLKVVAEGAMDRYYAQREAEAAAAASAPPVRSFGRKGL